MNEIWILEAGCRYEGGHVIGAYTTEEIGLRAVEQYMAKCISDTAIQSTPDQPCKTRFEKTKTEPDFHYWIEHYMWTFGTNDLFDGDAEYLSLKKLWLNRTI